MAKAKRQNPGLLDIGLVIGTYAAVPYVHLALEVRRLFYPGIAVLVVDDGSPKAEELERLCRSYGAAFVRNRRRLAWGLGDLAVYVTGFDWAVENGMRYLVKMSRRFIPLHNWVPGFRRLARQTGAATYSRRCVHFRYPFRTECVGFDVRAWWDSGSMERIRHAVLEGRISGQGTIHVEAFLYGLALDAERARARRGRAERRDAGWSGEYASWPILSEARTVPKRDILWHDANTPREYWAAAHSFGLDYRPVDFEDPNQEAGV